jgi:hypothetical protein
VCKKGNAWVSLNEYDNEYSHGNLFSSFFNIIWQCFKNLNIHSATSMKFSCFLKVHKPDTDHVTLYYAILNVSAILFYFWIMKQNHKKLSAAYELLYINLLEMCRCVRRCWTHLVWTPNIYEYKNTPDTRKLHQKLIHPSVGLIKLQVITLIF